MCLQTTALDHQSSAVETPSAGGALEKKKRLRTYGRTCAFEGHRHGIAHLGQRDGQRPVDGEAEGHVPGEYEAGAVFAAAHHGAHRLATVLRRRPAAAVGAARYVGGGEAVYLLLYR
ncbi:hypothetical protein BHM03_00057246, partial [Ensete ventricosum]